MSTPKFSSEAERRFFTEGMARVKLRRELAAAVKKSKAARKKGETAHFFANAAAGGERRLSRGKRTYKFFSTLGGTRAALHLA